MSGVFVDVSLVVRAAHLVRHGFCATVCALILGVTAEDLDTKSRKETQVLGYRRYYARVGNIQHCRLFRLRFDYISENTVIYFR